MLCALLAAAVVVLSPAPTPAEGLAEVASRPAVGQALAFIDHGEDRAVATLVSLASIESPSGGERERARWVAERMRAIGLQDVAVDASANVVGRIRGRSDRALVVVTMLDDLATVTELQRAAGRPPHREGDRVVGPATEIQSVNAAVLLAAEALVRAGVVPEHDLVLASVSQEETGLIGMTALYDQWKDRAEAWVEVLGDGHEIVYGAGTIHWWKIVAHGSEGHTEQTHLPDVNRGIARAVDRILSLPQPGRHEDTYASVGMIRSGEVYNHRPESGWFSLDLRSLDPGVVRDMERDVAKILGRVTEETGVRFDLEPVIALEGGQVPGAAESRLVRLATEVSRHLGYEPEVSPKGCCDMAVPVAHGRLAIGLHGEPGGQRATADEWADIPAMMRTARFVALLAAAY